MKLGTLVSRTEQDFWAETIPSKNLQFNSQYCTKKLRKEKGSPSVMASDSSVRSETQDWGCIGRCLFHPWENGNIIKIPSWSRVRECHDLESSDFCPLFQDSWKWTMVSFRLHFVCVIFSLTQPLLRWRWELMRHERWSSWKLRTLRWHKSTKTNQQYCNYALARSTRLKTRYIRETHWSFKSLREYGIPVAAALARKSKYRRILMDDTNW